jgi:NAD(P)-dependent dehydrogenase (short-subunit alcohol dehydrogenase family)
MADSKKLKNKTAVITGGNSGIGLATAKLYHEQGANVVITARSDKSFTKAQSEYGNQFEIIKADVTNLDELRGLAEKVKDKYGKIDILFANAGVAYFAPLSEVTNDFFDSQFNTNVKGLLFTIQQFAPLLNKGGSVILTTSGANTKGMPGSSVYAATKAAVRSMARTLSAELISQGIRVNALSPGPVETPIFGKTGMSEEELKGMAEQMQSATPIGRFGQPDEIANAALFLGSDDSSFVVGSELVADGGFSQL